MNIIEKVLNKLKPGNRDVPRNYHAAEIRYQPDKTGTERQFGTVTESATTNDTGKTEANLGQKTSKQINIDLARLYQLGIITRFDEKSRIAEEFRIIKRPLIQDSFNRSDGHSKNCNLIMVTSAMPGEGKTFCAINLAMSIAMEQDHTVLLVDADVARPSLPRYLGIRPDKGLMDVLLDDNLDLSDVILRTNIEKLSILPAGRRSKRATELLASQDMNELLTHISRRYHDRIVIFDSPPLVLTTESRVLASEMGQIVMVVEAENTPKKRVMEALEQIESCNDIKLIYNKSQPFNTSNYYDYYDQG